MTDSLRQFLLLIMLPPFDRPREYAATVLRDARPACVLATASSTSAASAAASAAANAAGAEGSSAACPVVILDWASLQNAPRDSRPSAAQPPAPAPPPPSAAAAAGGSSSDDRVAYVLYTSGSTGRPKGVLGTVSGILNRCAWGAAALPFAQGDIQALRTSPCFVDSVAELLCPLLAGAPALVVPPAADADPALLLRVLACGRATRLTAVPSLLAALLPILRQGAAAAAPADVPLLPLRLVVSSGEPLECALWRGLTGAVPGLRVVNIYGSTEVAADATFFDPAAEGGEATAEAAEWVPAGRPIDGVWAAILRGDGAPVREAGEVGELIIGGAGVALGYLGSDPSLTEQRFGTADGRGRFHFTGDLASWAPRGWIRLHGRADSQVKVRGQRVDLSGLERVAAAHPAVAAAAARLWEPQRLGGGALRGDGRIALYVELAAQTQPPQPAEGSEGAPAAAAEAAELRGWIAQRVPAAAAPSAVVVLSRLPRTPAGKLARGALQEPDWAEHARGWGSSAAATAGGGGRAAAAAPAAAQQPGAQRRASPADLPLVRSLCEGFSAVLGRAEPSHPGHASAAIPRASECCRRSFFDEGGTSVAAAALCGALGIGARAAAATKPSAFEQTLLRLSHSRHQHNPPDMGIPLAPSTGLQTLLDHPTPELLATCGLLPPLTGTVRDRLRLPGAQPPATAGGKEAAAARAPWVGSGGSGGARIVGGEGALTLDAMAPGEGGTCSAISPPAASRGNQQAPAGAGADTLSLQSAWRIAMGSCVDASPLLLLPVGRGRWRQPPTAGEEPDDSGAQAAAGAPPWEGRWRVVVGSHASIVTCVEFSPPMLGAEGADAPEPVAAQSAPPRVLWTTNVGCGLRLCAIALPLCLRVKPF